MHPNNTVKTSVEKNQMLFKTGQTSFIQVQLAAHLSTAFIPHHSERGAITLS